MDTYLIKGLYADRVILLFAIGNSRQYISIGFSELEKFFGAQICTHLRIDSTFEIMKVKIEITPISTVITLPPGVEHEQK